MADKVHPLEPFDQSVLQTGSDPFLEEFAKVEYLKKKSYFIQTEFHQQFYSWLHQMKDEGLDTNPVYMSGIEGIGKTTTLLYFALEQVQQKQNDVHYMDIKYFNMESSLEKFKTFVGDFKRGSLLIIDHATLDTVSVVEQITGEAMKRGLDVIVIETGFSASRHVSSFTVGKYFQLDEEEFINLWNGTLEQKPLAEKEKCRLLSEQGKNVYSELTKRFVVTPKLLKFVLNVMYSWGKSIGDAVNHQEILLRNEIEKFSVKDDDEQYLKFCLHTSILLHHIPPDNDFIVPQDALSHIYIAVNIFDTQQCQVTKDDLENDPRFQELNFEKGDTYVRLSHLVPVFAVYWRKRLPYSLESVLQANDDTVFGVMFTFESVRKKYEELLVRFQMEKKLAIYPSGELGQTVYEPSNTCCDLIQTDSMFLLGMKSEDRYLSPTSASLSAIDTDQGSEETVARCAVLVQRIIEQDENRALLVYPQTANLMGIDYFLYCPCPVNQGPFLPTKKQKLQKILHLVKVATGATHSGDTIGEALDLVQQIFSAVDIIIHVSIIIAKNGSSPYRLLKSRFQNVSVINLATYKHLLADNNLLHKLTEELAKLSGQVKI